MQLQDDYLTAYRSLKLTRDSEGVLVAEFHSNNGPFTFTEQDHTQFVDAFYRIEQDRNSDGSGRRVYSLHRFFVFRQRRRSRRLEPGSRRGRSDCGEYSQHTRSDDRGYRGTRPCALRVCPTCQCDGGGRGCDLPRYSTLRRRHCARRWNFYYLELSRWSRTGRGFLAEPTAADGAHRTRMGSG